MREGLTARETLLVFLAVGITLLLSMFVSALYRHEYRPAVASVAPAAILTYFFFRHRKVILTLVGLTFLFLNVGLHNMFHPSVSGYLVTFGSAGGLFLLIWWRVQKRSQLGRRAGPQDMHKLFDKDFGDSL
jgi:hypothetical protein